MKILVVEDNKENLYMLETLLKGSGYDVISAKNGVEALEKLKKDSIDMIISDILMPKMDGFQLCRACKSNDMLRKIPFVFYTATYTDVKDKEFALSLGAEMFIIKPVDPNVFLKILESIIKEHKKRGFVTPKRPIGEEIVYLEEYNKRLIIKLERKMLDLEKANKQLTQHITERKKVEENLRETRDHLENLLNYANAPIIAWDPKFKITHFNPAFERLTGRSASKTLGATLDILFPKERREKSMDFIRRTSTGKRWETVEIPILHTDGTVRTVLWNSANLYASDGTTIVATIAQGVDITKRKQAEKETVRTKEYLQNIINSASEVIISFDKNNRVTTWNKAAEYVTGYKQRQIVGRYINELDLFDNSNDLVNTIKSIYSGHKYVSDEIILRAKYGTKRIITSSYSIIKSDKEESIGILFVGKDITHERESHGKMIKGNSYLIPDKNNKSAIDLFVYLTKSGYEGLFITRANPETIKSMIPSADIKVKLLNQNKLERFDNISDLEGLKAKINEFCKKHTDAVILLNRVDYLLTNFSFDQFVKSLYQINDIISKNNSILLLHLDPSIIDARQLAIIENELHLLPHQKIEHVQIDEGLFDILTFIYKQNQNNTLVSFTNIGNEFSIVRPTTAKRLRTLEDSGLIFIKKRGKSKTLYVTEKGRTLLNKRRCI